MVMSCRGALSMSRRQTAGIVLSESVFAFLCLWGGAAQSAPPQVQIPTEEQLQAGDEYTPANGNFLSGLARTNFLLGNMGGLRPFLAQYGISLAVQETSEVLGNATGGTRTGVEYDG